MANQRPGPSRGHITRAVKSRMFSVENTVDYVEEKIKEAYAAGLADGAEAPADDSGNQEANSTDGDDGNLFEGDEEEAA